MTRHLLAALLALGLGLGFATRPGEAAGISRPEAVVQPVQYYGYYGRGYYGPRHDYHGRGFYRPGFYGYGPGYHRRGFYGPGFYGRGYGYGPGFYGRGYYGRRFYR